MGNFTHDQKAAAVAHAAHVYAKAASQQEQQPLSSLANRLLATVSILIGESVRRVDERPEGR
jgi:hypothetical protein